MKKKVFIDGSEGTTGLRIFERFESRDDIELLKIPSELRKDPVEVKKYINESDITFLCLPDAAAREAVAMVENENTIILDTSTAHRTEAGWAYGYPELSAAHREAIRTGKRIAVPGCYATGFITTAYALTAGGILPKDYPVSAFAVSGYSGGGKKMIAQYQAQDKEKELSIQLDEMKKEWEANLKENRQTVDAEEIANVISMMSGIPVQRMAQAEGIKLAGMKEDLQAKVIAQDTAIEKLVKAILRSRVGLKDPNKPIGTFMFLGPTGVGKTHLAKELAKYMFGSADALIRIDMSEYMEKFTVSRLVGAPPGYVGYEEGGQLTEKVRRKPYSIVLLDEIEKAHPDVFNILLQVMDEGRLTDSYGRMVDFKNTVIIMTSNIGTRQLKEFGRGVGFATQSRLDDKEFSRSVIQKALNKSFAPEFINRVDEIITFDQLSLEAITKIIDIELKGLYDRIESIGYKLVIEDKAKEFIAGKGYDVQYGARPLKRAIQTYLEDGLSELIISSSLKEGDTIQVSLNEEKGELEMKVVTPE